MYFCGIFILFRKYSVNSLLHLLTSANALSLNDGLYAQPDLLGHVWPHGCTVIWIHDRVQLPCAATDDEV